MREGRLELPRPLGHRILRLLALRTDVDSACRSVPSGVVLRPRMSSCREQDVSKSQSLAWPGDDLGRASFTNPAFYIEQALGTIAKTVRFQVVPYPPERAAV